MKLSIVCYTILISCFTFTISFAKKAPKPSYVNSFKYHYLNTKKAEVDYKNYNLFVSPNSKQSAVNTFLQNKKPNLFSGKKSIKLVNATETKKAAYYQYHQYYNKIPVYNSGITVALSNNNKIFSSVYNTYIFNDEVLKTKQPLLAEAKLITPYFENTTDSIVIKNVEIAVFINDENAMPHYAYVVDFKNFNKNWYHQIVLSKELDLLFAKDLRSYFNGNETTVTAKVFNPDPLTTAQKLYGGNYKDNKDSNSVYLNNEQVDLEIPVYKQGEQYVLKSEFISIEELENPVTNATVFDSNTLNFGRMATAFENLNVIYHINTFNNYLISIGYENLVKPIAVDAHAALGDDNSYFEPDSNIPSLLFGEGGVDDAEDADVVIHEYGHAISHQAAPNTNKGTQRQSVDEGFGDYIAASYSRSVNEFGWQRVFSWDGHNEYWSGRFADTDKVYPNDLFNQVHSDGEIWCRSLVDIEDAIGRDNTHQILLESMHQYQRNITMVDAANLFVQADSLLFNGANYFEIWKAFFNRGFLEYQVFAGKDTIICTGDEIRIDAENLLPPNSIISWSPNQNIRNPNISAPFVYPNSSTLYTLTVTVDDIDYTDDVFIEVDTCNSTEINLLDFNGYLSGAYILLNLPDNVNKQKLVMNLFSNNGQAYNFYPEPISSNTYKARVDKLPKGVYFLRIIDKNFKQYVFKFLKT